MNDNFTNNGTIGVVICGGDCPGLNAVLRAIVKSGIHKYGYAFLGFKGGFSGLLKNEFIHLKESDVSGVLDLGGTILGTTVNDVLFKADWNDDQTADEYINTIRDNMQMHDMTALIIIGGDQAMKVAVRLNEAGINVVGVPKSINNNLMLTDMTLGCTTAVYTATDEIDKLHMTAETEHRAIVVEVVGEKTGWVATKAGIAGGADVILIPEIRYDIKKVARSILERKNKGKNFSMIVIASGAKCIEDDDPAKDNDDAVNITAGNRLVSQLKEYIDVDYDIVLLGNILRGGRPSAYDRVLASQEGVYAVEMVRNEEFGRCVCLRNDEIISENIADMIVHAKGVDRNSDLIDVAKSIGVSFGD